jgi:hypothetical protein
MIDGLADSPEPLALIGLLVFFFGMVAFIVALSDWNNHR